MKPVVYVSKKCPACDILTEYLELNNIEYILKDTNIIENKKHMLRKGVLRTPYIEFGDRFMVGFNGWEDLDEFFKQNNIK